MRCTLSGGGPEMSPWTEEKAAATFTSFSHLLSQPPAAFLLPCSLSPFLCCLCAMCCASAPLPITPFPLAFLLLPHCPSTSSFVCESTAQSTCGTQRMACKFSKLLSASRPSRWQPCRLSARLDLLFSKSGKSLELLLVLPTPA